MFRVRVRLRRVKRIVHLFINILVFDWNIFVIFHLPTHSFCCCCCSLLLPTCCLFAKSHNNAKINKWLCDRYENALARASPCVILVRSYFVYIISIFQSNSVSVCVWVGVCKHLVVTVVEAIEQHGQRLFEVLQVQRTQADTRHTLLGLGLVCLQKKVPLSLSLSLCPTLSLAYPNLLTSLAHFHFL